MTTAIAFVAVPSDDAHTASRDMLAANMTNYVLLFGGDRWEHVTHVAVARDDVGSLVGLASLAMHGEDGHSTPEIVGVWVHPDHRCQGIGTRLLTRCVHEATLLGTEQPLRISVVTIAGHALARRACERGLWLDVRSSSGFGDLP